MIDFRYHLVSIVSIFLALAVGIVLGAGPLQGEIGDTLKNEVAGLRQDKADLNAQLDSTRSGLEARDGYVAATNPLVLADALLDHTVAVVVLPGADAGVAESTSAILKTAGARIVSTTTLTEDWVSTQTSTTSVRNAVVRRVAGTTGVELTEGGTVAPRDELLASLLARPSGVGTAILDPETARAGLADLADAGLLTVDVPDGAFARADEVVVVAGSVTAGDAEAQTAAAGSWVDLAVALDERSQGTVLAAAESTEGEGVSVLATLRQDPTATRSVSSVDDADDPMGQASVVHALLEQATGSAGQYGLATGAEAPFAPLPSPAP